MVFNKIGFDEKRGCLSGLVCELIEQTKQTEHRKISVIGCLSSGTVKKLNMVHKRCGQTTASMWTNSRNDHQRFLFFFCTAFASLSQ